MTEPDNPYRPSQALPTKVFVFRIRLIPATMFGLSGILVLVGVLIRGGLMVWSLTHPGSRSPAPELRPPLPLTIESLAFLALSAAIGGFALLASFAWINGRWLRAVGMSVTSCLLMALTAIIAPE